MGHEHKSRETLQRRTKQAARTSQGSPMQRRPVQRIGSPLPPGCRVDNIEDGQPDTILAMIESLQHSMTAGGSPNFRQQSAIPERVRAAFGEDSFSSSTITDPGGYLDDFLINHQWHVEVRLNVVGPETPVGGAGVGTSEGGSTGSSTGSVGRTDSESTTASVSGTVGSSSGSERGPDTARATTGGSASGTGEVGTTVGSERSRTAGRSGERATAVSGATDQQMYRRMICADISIRVTAEPIEGALDLNPFTIGANIASAMIDTVDAVAGTTMQTRSTTVPFCGYVVYSRTTGLRASGGGGDGS
jgi:hypothetical protein